MLKIPRLKTQSSNYVFIWSCFAIFGEVFIYVVLLIFVPEKWSLFCLLKSSFFNDFYFDTKFLPKLKNLSLLTTHTVEYVTFIKFFIYTICQFYHTHMCVIFDVQSNLS